MALQTVPCRQGCKTEVNLIASSSSNIYTAIIKKELENDMKRNAFNGIAISGHEIFIRAEICR